MKHIDLFSGIGGFALAVDTVWPGSEHIFCDNDPFCQQILKKHWPNSKIYGDIRTLTNTESEQNRGLQQSRFQSHTRTILTGGFPCQPFSQAGRRQGTADDRYLWPEMFRVIREFKPTWVIAENVRGLVTWNEGMVLEQVCADLESEGYEVQPLIIPAVAVNAPHRRDRVWFIAYRTGRGQRSSESERDRQRKPEAQTGNDNSDATNTESQGEWAESELSRSREKLGSSDRAYSWNKNWIEVATELCGVDDGLPAELDGFKLTKSAHRRERLKSLGNAIVPQVAIEIMRAIKSSYDPHRA